MNTRFFSYFQPGFDPIQGSKWLEMLHFMTYKCLIPSSELSEETAVLCYNSKTTYGVVARLKMNTILKENSFPPRTIHDENGTWTGVILSVPDFQTFLRLLIEYADWENLPSYLQDAVDNMLADEAEEEEGVAQRIRNPLLPITVH